MRKLRQAIAILIAAALLIEPCGMAGSVNEVKAAETTAKVYEQMKVRDISIKADGFDKDAIEVGNEGVKFTVDVAVDVPEGWSVSQVVLDWYAVNDEEGGFSTIGTFNIASQPEDSVYSLENKLHKYEKADIYYLAEVNVKFVPKDGSKIEYMLYGEASEYNKVASAANPVEFEWEIWDSDFDVDEYLDNTKYTGTADFTILSSTGKDNTAPKLKGLKMNTQGVLNSGMLTEINVTVQEDVSGIATIEMVSLTDDIEMETFVFNSGEMEKYTGTQTITVRGASENLKYRMSGKYFVAILAISDHAGNYVEYYIDDNYNYLIAEDYVQNDDGSYDEVTHKIKTVKYSVCNGHVYKNSVTKATTSANGSISKKCKYCDAVKAGSKTTISRIKKVKLSKTSYVYDGKVKKPTVSVYDAGGKKIESNNYTVTYPSGCKLAGEYKIKITFKNNYKGTVYKTYTIKPKGTSIASTSAGTKKFTVKWKKQATQTTGYQIRYSTSSDFKSYSSKNVTNKKSTSTTIKNLKAGKKYYVQVRTFKTVKINGKNKKIYSAWSGVKSIKTK